MKNYGVSQKPVQGVPNQLVKDPLDQILNVQLRRRSEVLFFKGGALLNGSDPIKSVRYNTGLSK